LSEFQYYHFETIDTPLTEKQQDELRAISSRAEITDTTFVNEYNYGDFRGDPTKVTAKYFDVMMYYSNFGNQELRFRFPKSAINLPMLKKYEAADVTEFEIAGNFVVVSMLQNDEDSSRDFYEHFGKVISAIPSIREDILNGDYRILYISWLGGVMRGYVDEDSEEPPVPPGLKELTKPLKQLVDFFDLDNDWIEAAAQASGVPPTIDTAAQKTDWVKTVSEADKNDWIVRLISGEPAGVLGEIRSRFLNDRPVPVATKSSKKRRTASEIEELGKNLQETIAQQRAEQERAERERRLAESTAQRQKVINAHVGKEPMLWKQVEEAVEQRLASGYDTVIEKLTLLHDLAKRNKTTDAFTTKMREFRKTHARKSAMIRRLNDKQFPR